MGQQPNIVPAPADLPRPVPEPGPPRLGPDRRPGVVNSPGEMPWGGAFGTPGPDTGWGLTLVKRSGLAGDSADLEGVLGSIVAARASLRGRAPVPDDVEAAKLLCGLAEGQAEWLGERRRRWVKAAAHEPAKGRSAVAEIGEDMLSLTTSQLAASLGGAR
jgi:hypothetical protein